MIVVTKNKILSDIKMFLLSKNVRERGSEYNPFSLSLKLFVTREVPPSYKNV
mgnify:CR=1 FL=1